MAVYMHTLWLQGPLGGSSESFHFRRDAVTDFYGLLKQLRVVASARQAMCGANWLVTRSGLTRLLDDDSEPDRFALSEKIQFTLLDPAPPAEMNKDICVTVRFWDQERERFRDMFLAGCPRGINDSDDNYTPTNQWNSAFNNWRSKLYTFSPGLLRNVRGGKVNVIGYTVSDTGAVTVQIDADLPNKKIGEPFAVRLAGINGKSELNGQWTAYNYRDATAPLAGYQFDLKGKFGLIPFETVGTASAYTYPFVPVRAGVVGNDGNVLQDGIEVFGIEKRQRGKAYAAGRGRASARVRT